ncbi:MULTISPECIES: DUF2630 family protein [Streptomyces]|uniref:DUF2630 family protein n=2 Tax=Streptomyces TaxID=1883 RepID=A0ABT9KVC5_9ACTN|nr:MULTISPECIES: DUF2630 family protein [Streptomyces]MDN3061124.1 DUF2630 family protein [Streptomyces sp. SRF1]MDP9612403.1 hypothetical protein [Streptomyces demainii]GHJ26554.1 hypothetical protein TPA0910_09870 [Streptomyces hygroscopicus]GLV75569.1 hypothetical protein Shyhy02_35690 [Streptomyces hygroscopicus subsp. hygroscopicus]
MADDILRTIDALVDEEHRLRDQAVGKGLGPDERTRLTAVERQLDQCWDLLRRRRATAEAGQDPEQARPRTIDEVESYEQ